MLPGLFQCTWRFLCITTTFWATAVFFPGFCLICLRRFSPREWNVRHFMKRKGPIQKFLNECLKAIIFFFFHNFPTKRWIQFPDSSFWIKLIQIKISYIQKIHYTCNFFVNFWWYLTLRSYKVIVHWWYPIFTQLNYWIFYVFDRSSFEDKTGKKIGGGCS